MRYTLTINGQIHDIEADEDTPLLWVLRDWLHLTGTKFGCGVASCGACTVSVAGVPTRSCQLRVSEAEGVAITTIEGLDQLASPVTQAVQQAWRDLDVVQCGYCQSGQIVSAVALLEENSKPNDADIDAAMYGNACRCATYVRIRAAIHAAAHKLEG